MSSSLLDHLRTLLEDVTASLPGVAMKRAFGSFGFFANDAIFALAFAKDGRIGVKLPEAEDYARLMATPGSAVWAPHKAPMSHWVLVPEAFHDDAEALRIWVMRAHTLATLQPAKVKKPAAKKKAAAPKAKKPAVKKAPAKAKAPAKKKPVSKRAR